MLRRYQHCDPGGLLELLWGSLFKFRWFKLACCAATEKLRVGIGVGRWSLCLSNKYDDTDQRGYDPVFCISSTWAEQIGLAIGGR